MRFLFAFVVMLVLVTNSAQARTSKQIISMFNDNPEAMLLDGKPINRAERGPFGSVCGYDRADQLIGCRNKKEMNGLIDAWVKGGSKKPQVINGAPIKKADDKAKAKAKAKAKVKSNAPKAPTKKNALATMASVKSLKPSAVMAYANAANGQAEVWIADAKLSTLPSFETKVKFVLNCKDDWGDAMFAPMTLKGQVINGAIFVTDDQVGNAENLEKIGRGVYSACALSDMKWKVTWQ